MITYLGTENMLARAKKISFICHSFGGVICRAALAHEYCKPLLPKLHTLVTLSGPHLGMLYCTNSLVELGIWGLRKFRKAQCLCARPLLEPAARAAAPRAASAQDWRSH